MEKIVIRTPNWLGDCVLSLSAVKGIRKIFPGAELSVLTKANLVSFWQLVPGIDKILIYQGLRKSFINQLQGYGFSRAVVFPNSWSSALLFYLAGIPRRRGYRIRGRGWLFTEPIRVTEDGKKQHQSEYYLDLVSGLGSFPDLDKPAIPVSSALRKKAEELLIGYNWHPGEPVVGMHAVAKYGPAKCWLPERFSVLAGELQKKYNCWIFFCGAAEETGLVERMLAGLSNRARVLNLAGQTDIGELAGLVSLCRVFVANDSGPMHLAAAVGVPLVAVFGSTDPLRTGPRGNCIVIKKDLSCSPCLQRICSGGLECMRQVTVAEVMEAVNRLW